jgi:hypothetical protein
MKRMRRRRRTFKLACGLISSICEVRFAGLELVDMDAFNKA